MGIEALSKGEIWDHKNYALTFIGRRRSSFQFIETPFGVFDVIDQTIPDVVQHLNGVVNTSCEDIELSKV